MESGIFNNWFNKKTITKLIEKDVDEKVSNQLVNSERLYKEMSLSYRNEFFYKNTLFNKYVLGTYSLNTTVALSEFEIDNSKADFAIINKRKSFVVEIKTDLDTLDKLIYQIEDYYKVFSLVYVLTSENYFYQVYRLVKNTRVGIMVLTKRNNISIRKFAKDNFSKLKHENLFRLLRKEEYEDLVESQFKEVPNVKPIFRYSTYLDIFKQLGLEKSQELVFNKVLRRINGYDVEYLKRVPLELRWLVYQSHLNREKFERLLNNLQGGI
ncbi:sce7726 family protein [Virgibacillus halodenitrificans]|uniref:sce7726 family protein n=1 Tax=Virgibacillus halodenitrificans TaxID=1482 RepID=UPI001FB26155|nr:sce7726 family protein [Virgibacillus halodenitrificans]MCJ0931864.1 sce7726 family protein [Virgibacillus halodenitrificans]